MSASENRRDGWAGSRAQACHVRIQTRAVEPSRRATGMAPDRLCDRLCIIWRTPCPALLVLSPVVFVVLTVSFCPGSANHGARGSEPLQVAWELSPDRVGSGPRHSCGGTERTGIRDQPSCKTTSAATSPEWRRDERREMHPVRGRRMAPPPTLRSVAANVGGAAMPRLSLSQCHPKLAPLSVCAVRLDSAARHVSVTGPCSLARCSSCWQGD